MNIILFDAKERINLQPLTFIRPIAELRMGILTFKERWAKLIPDSKLSYLTEDYLTKKYPLNVEEYNIFINPTYFPNTELVSCIRGLDRDEALYTDKGNLVASYTSLETFQNLDFKEKKYINYQGIKIEYPWDLFSYNDYAISFDFHLVTKNRESQILSDTVKVIGDPTKIFLEKGVVAEYIILNTNGGEIYIGENTEIMEGSMIRGGLALCEGAKINMGSKIYGGTTIGPYSKVGGEVNNVVITGYSNKGHEGFLGNSVLGEWCNLGADTNSSNMKNNYAEVKYWSYAQSKFISSGLQFAGLIMGDHSKSSINTQFNTGTIVGVSANIFTTGFPPNNIKSFSWGGATKSPLFKIEKALEVAERVMQRRNVILTEIDKKILIHIYELFL